MPRLSMAQYGPDLENTAQCFTNTRNDKLAGQSKPIELVGAMFLHFRMRYASDENENKAIQDELE